MKKLLVGLVAFSLLLGVGVANAQNAETNGSTDTVKRQLSPSNVIPLPIRVSPPQKNDETYPFSRVSHRVSGNTHLVSGIISLGTPCHSFETSVSVKDSVPQSTIIEFTTRDKSSSDLGCIQVEKDEKFEVKFEAREDAIVQLAHNGNIVFTLNRLDKSLDRDVRILELKNDKAEDLDNTEEKRVGGNEGEKIRDRATDVRKDADRLTEEVVDRIKNRVEAYFEKMVVRIEAAFDRMARLIERTESRITKLEENGLETEEALEFVGEAKRHLEEGKAYFAGAVAKMREGIVDSENPRELLSEIKSEIKEATNSLKEAHEALRNAVRVLKSQNANNEE